MALTIRTDDRLDELAHRILAGELQIVADGTTVPLADVETTLDVDSLRGLARVCDREHLHIEAARIRRWLSDQP